MSDTAQFPPLPFGEQATSEPAATLYGLSPAEQQQLSRECPKTGHLDDLLLARACALGRDAAWDCFVRRYRRKLYWFALSMTRDESAAAEIADSVYGDLFGTRVAQDGHRVSKLNSYSGTGSLEGWLKTILAQEYVNRLRHTKHFTAWDQDLCETSAPPQADHAQSSLDRLTEAADAALAALGDVDRLLLSLYYLDECSLAQIARVLGRHESSVARRIRKLTQALRKDILRALRAFGIPKSEAEGLLASDVRLLNIDVRERLRATQHATPEERQPAALPE